MKPIILIGAFALVFFTGCRSGPPEKRVAGWEDWELCQRLADYAYQSESGWLWYVAGEIKKRDLTSDPRCKSVYDSRMRLYMRRENATNIRISFGEALNRPGNFEEVVPSED